MSPCLQLFAHYLYFTTSILFWPWTCIVGDVELFVCIGSLACVYCVMVHPFNFDCKSVVLGRPEHWVHSEDTNGIFLRWKGWKCAECRLSSCGTDLTFANISSSLISRWLIQGMTSSSVNAKITRILFGWGEDFGLKETELEATSTKWESVILEKCAGLL